MLLLEPFCGDAAAQSDKQAELALQIPLVWRNRDVFLWPYNTLVTLSLPDTKQHFLPLCSM